MGNQPAKQTNSNKKDEALILFSAGKIVKELNLFSSDRQSRQQQHLIARFMVYGHGHLIDHLKTLPRQAKFNFLRYLRQIDIETMDLLYQNYIQKRMTFNKSKHRLLYDKVNYIDKKQESHISHWINVAEEKAKYFFDYAQVGIILFAGGNSSRFNDPNQQKQFHKELYTQKQGQKSLLEIKLDRIQQIGNEYGEQVVYLVYNENSLQAINQLLKNYSKFKVKRVLQNQNWVVTLSGKLCLKSKDDYYLYQAPSGCGDIINANIKGKKITEDLTQQGLQYICCIGIENILQDVLDPYILGVICSNQQLGVVYKCTYPENENEEACRVLYNVETKQVQMKNIENFLEVGHPSCIQKIKRSPIWTNSCIIRVAAIKKSMQYRINRLSQIKQVEQIYTVRKSKRTYFNPTEQVYVKNQYCYVFQRELTDFLMASNMKMQAVMIPRQQQYMPVISINGEMIWRDAYQQYELLKNKKEKRSSENGMMSKWPLSSLVRIESKQGDDGPNQMTKQQNERGQGQFWYEDSLLTLQKEEQEEIS